MNTTWCVIILIFSILCYVKSELSSENIEELLHWKKVTDVLSSKNEVFVPIEDDVYNPNLIYFYVYSNTNTDGVQIYFNQSTELANLTSFDPSIYTVVLIHGWTNNYISPVNIYLKDALFAVDEYNIIVVDWSSYGNGLYVSSVANAQNVGGTIAEFIKNISETLSYSLDNIIVMGHSMGGQIAGFLGQETNGELNTIIGLDPAGPLYFENLPDSRLSADDAKYVQGIHTNAALKGVNFNVGVIDFWPNGGYLQAGCGTDILGSCSHRRAFEYMAESIESNRFYARLCDSYNNYLAQSCINNTQARMGGPKYDKTLSGTYYLQTHETSPYALGNIN